MKQTIVLLTLLLVPTLIYAGECKTDKDCKGDRVCYNQSCLSPSVAEKYELEDFSKSRSQAAPALTQTTGTEAAKVSTAPTPAPNPTADVSVSPPETQAGVNVQPQPEALPNPDNLGLNQSALSVVLKKPVADAVVFVDGQKVGTAPWRGVVAPGEHKVRVEAPGMRPKTKSTDVWPSRSRTLELRLYQGSYAPFGVMLSLSAVSFGLLIFGAVEYSEEKAEVAGSSSDDPWFQDIERDMKQSAVCLGINIAVLAVSIPLTILFGIHPEWFSKKHR